MSDLEFTKRYKQLNPEQKLAVDTIEGPVMVIAGPGTGKTTILTLRIAHILRETDTPPSGILALTFTEAGVKAMRTKLRDIIGSRADEVRIHTFHGFASSVIAEFPEHFVHLSRSKQITDIEAESLLREILKNKKYSKLRPLGDVDFYLHKIISGISDCKKEAWSPDTIKQFAFNEKERIIHDPDSLSTRGATKGQLKGDSLKRIEKCEKTLLFADVYQEYEVQKKNDKKMDFDDLLFELLHGLQTDTLLLQLLQEKFLYILVDEHQDTNDSQNMIISLLANFFETPNIFVVGDEKQAIYRFQGASVQNFLRFQKIWKDMKIIPLTNNYRSHQGILDASFSMIENNYEEGEYVDLRVKLQSGLKNKPKPLDIVYAPDNHSADEYLVTELQRISKTEPDATVAVILRWNKDVDHVLSLCEAHGLMVSAERGVDIFSHPLGTLYFKLLEYLHDPSQIESLAYTIAGGLWSLDFVKTTELLKLIRSGDMSTIETEIPALVTLREELTRTGVIAYIMLAGELSGVTSPKNMNNPLSIEVWRGIIDLSRDLATQSRVDDPRALIKELLDYKKTSENKTIKIGAGKNDSRIQIMTAHSSKGLEYDYVFLPYALEEYWMRASRSSSFIFPREKDTSDEVKDSRRLFYVAVTRARKHVVTIIPTSDNMGRHFTSVRFIDEFHPDHVSKIEIPKTNTLPMVLHGENLIAHKKTELIEYAKRILSDNGLSVTALNHFMNCPSEFLYKSVLKVPEAPNASSEKGIAMHMAIAEVWRNRNTDTTAITHTIEQSVKSFFQTSLLSAGDKEIIVDELLTNAPIVARALAPHFAIQGHVHTEKWVQKNINVQSAQQEIVLKIHGQMDAIVDTDDALLVFDYKTRPSMSVQAIKGETSSSDGNYFRQLVFYKMLLDKNVSFESKTVEPALVFIKPDDKGRCPVVTLPITDEDVSKVMAEIGSLVDSVYSGSFLVDTCSDVECQYCRYKTLL